LNNAPEVPLPPFQSRARQQAVPRLFQQTPGVVSLMIAALNRHIGAPHVGKSYGGYPTSLARRVSFPGWRKRLPRRLAPIHWFLAVLPLVCLQAADGPRVSYFKSFPGSVPAYMAITLDRTGAGEYKEAEDDDSPVRFQLSEADTSEIFGLAGKLGYFDHPLESGLKVAFMGAKTFRYEDGAKKSEVKFNFSEDLTARALADWFERIAESEQLLSGLEVSAKYDKLGVMKALLLLESYFDRKRLVNTQQYLPLLDRIAKNESYMHQARLRAASLADEMRAPK